MAKYLTDKSEKVLQDTVEAVKKLTPHPIPQEQPHSYQASQTYIARTPSGGIAALSQNDLGTNSDDQPGYVEECPIYRIDAVGGLMEAYEDLTKPVWNMSNKEVPGDTWVIITKAKNGTWLVVQPSPSTYIARTPSGGIAALDDNDTGTTPDDSPGSASCNIFYIDEYGEMAPAGFYKTVYNMAQFAVDGNIWIVINQTEFGPWVVSYPQQPFDRCNATVKGDPTGTASTITVDNVVATRGATPVDGSSEELTVDNPFGTEFSDSDNVKIEYNYSDDSWEIYAPEQSQATWLIGTAASQFLSGGTITINSSPTYKNGEAPASDPSTVANGLGLTGNSGATVYAMHDGDGSYTAWNVSHVAEEFMTDFRVYDAEFKLQDKRRTHSIMPREAEDATWNDLYTGDDCSGT